MAKTGDVMRANVELGGFYPRGLAWLDIKEKYKRMAQAKDETIAALEMLCGMFEYDGLPESVDTDFLELYLLTDGMASIRKDNDGNYVAMQCSEGSGPNAYGLGTEIISVTRNGQEFTDDRDSAEVAFGYNNATKTPCTDYFKLGADIAEIDTSLDFLVWYSRVSRLYKVADEKQRTMLEDAFKLGADIAEIDTSLDFLVWYSRVSRLYAVADEKQRIMIEDAFKNLKKGVPLTIVSNNLIQEIENGAPGITPFDLTDSDYADKIMRLCEYREARFKWFGDRYGMAKRSVAKKAQVSEDEANGDTAAALIIPLNMLKAREMLIKMCNDRFGWSAEVHFNGAYLGEVERYEDTVVENADLDIDGYEAVQDPKQEPDQGDNKEEKEGGDNDDTGIKDDNNT